MRKVIYGYSCSIDGFIEGGGGDWMIPSAELHQYFNDFERERISTYLYGRTMWELMSGFWPTADQPSESKEVREYAGIWASKEKVVFSRTLKSVDGARLAGPDLEDEVRRLKEQAGKDMTVGGANLAATFFRLGLIDEVWMYVVPVVLGSGKPMFQGFKEPARLEPLEMRPIAEVTLLRYAVPAPDRGA